MVKRVVVGVTARGYVDGRYIGEEKDNNRGGDDRGRPRRGKAGAGPAGGKRRAAGGDADNLGNTIGGKRRRSGQGKAQIPPALIPANVTLNDPTVYSLTWDNTEYSPTTASSRPARLDALARSRSPAGCRQ